MSKKKIFVISSLSVIALAILTAIVIMVISIIKRTDDVGSRGKDRSDDKKSSPTKTIERNPLDVIGVDTKTISGTLTISECLEKSQKNPLVFYLLEGTPKKDADVDAVIVFFQGKVITFDNTTVSARYEDRTIGELIKLDQTELIQNLKEEYAKQVKTAIATLIGDNKRIILPVGLYQKKALGEEITEEDIRREIPYYLCKDLPVDSDFYLILYTDDSGNNTERELLMIPDAWRCNNVMFANDEDGLMAGCSSSEFVMRGYVLDDDVSYIDLLVGCSKYNPNTDLTEWASEYMEMREELEEEGILLNTIDVLEVDVTQTQSGTIYDSEYIGFNVPGKGTMIAICEPESAVTADDPAKARENASIIVDPKQEQYYEIKYVMSQGIYDSVECILDKTSVAEYLDPKLNKQFAEELLQEGDYEWAYMLLEYLGLHKDVLANKYERAKVAYDTAKTQDSAGYYDSAVWYYESAEKLYRESQHGDEIEALRYDWALSLIKLERYDSAYSMLEELGCNDVIIQNKYERAKAYLFSEEYDSAYRLLEESGHKDEISQSKYERACEAIKNDCYDLATELLMELDYKDSKELLEKSKGAKWLLKWDFDTDPEGEIVEDGHKIWVSKYEGRFVDLIHTDIYEDHSDWKNSSIEPYDGKKSDNRYLCLKGAYNYMYTQGIMSISDYRGRLIKVSFDVDAYPWYEPRCDVFIACYMDVGAYSWPYYPIHPEFCSIERSKNDSGWAHCEGFLFCPDEDFIQDISISFTVSTTNKDNLELKIDNLKIVYWEDGPEYEAYKAEWEKTKMEKWNN